MKKILSYLLTVLLLVQTFMNTVYAQDSKTYTPDDFLYDKIYNFKAGDKISFGGDTFDVFFYSDTLSQADDVKEYVFEKDTYASIRNYSLDDNDRYVGINIEYRVTYDLSGKGDSIIDYSKYYWYSSEKVGRSWAAMPTIPTATNYMFEYWCSDSELKNKIDDWDSSGEHQIYGDTTFYAKWAEVELVCIEVQGLSETKPGEDIELQIVPVANNERIYDVSKFAKEDRPIICASVEGALGIQEISFDEERNGYFYKFTPSENEDEYIINFYIKNNSTINTEYCIDAYDVSSDEILANNGWPWGSDFKISGDKYSVKLNTKAHLLPFNIKYQWQTSSDNANYYDIPGANWPTHTVEVKDYTKFDNCWFRCFITYKRNGEEYQCVSKAVKIIDSREINSNIDELYSSLLNTNTNRNIKGTLEGLYISNDLGAYSLGSNGGNQYFNVLGKYNNGLRNYWTSASCDAAWALYFKNNNHFVSEKNIKEVICNFDDGTSTVNFNFKLRWRSDVALYTDLCIGRFPEVYFADSAVIRANMKCNALESIQSVTNGSFETANLNECIGFNFIPKTRVSAFNLDALVNGPYNDKRMGRYQYITNDYNNEESLSYKDIFNVLKSEIFDYNDGTFNETYTGNDPFVYGRLGLKKIVVGMSGKDAVLSCAWKNRRSIKFSMAIGNATNVGIEENSVPDQPEKLEVSEEPTKPDTPKKTSTSTYSIPKTGIN